ncbi:Uncharacterised protein [Mycobacteroides abscessus]|nr:Uncharacterised protein [Mycobacteroides abscessus]
MIVQVPSPFGVGPAEIDFSIPISGRDAHAPSSATIPLWSRLAEFARPPSAPDPGGGHCRSTGSIVASSIWTVTSTW